MGLIENRTFDEIAVGDSAELSHILTQQDIQIFAAMSGDVNPAHVDEEYAANSRFHKVIAHGMWGGSMISTLLGTELPGPGTIYVAQTLNFHRPVGVGDTIIARVTVTSKQDKNRILFDCVCQNQAGETVITGEATVIAPAEKITRERVKRPELEIKETRVTRYEQLLALTDGFAPLRVGVVHPTDGNSLGGAIAAAEDGIITPILIGPEDKIRATAEAESIDLSPYEIAAVPHSHAAAEKAAELSADGTLEALMKGKLHTDELMHAILTRPALRTERRMSHVFALDAPSYHKPLYMTDAAINIAPTLEHKVDIVQNAIDLFTTCGFGTPKVAIVSAIETVNAQVPSTLDATALCKMAERGQITGGILDGPLGFDNAISKEAAEAKGIRSDVAGDADIIIVPDLESGNMLYKQMRYMSGAEAAGVVLGARVPIILTSRAAGKGITRKMSAALTLLYVRKKNPLSSEHGVDL